MRFSTETITLQSRKGPEFIDITLAVAEKVATSGIGNGYVVIFSRHTTAAVRINENEPRLLRDMEELLERLAPPSAPYHHNCLGSPLAGSEEEEDTNGHAHCQHLLLGASETVPLVDGKLQLGRWQRIFLIELDRPRVREVLIQVVGV